MEVKVKEVASRDIQCVNSVIFHFMGIMNYILICLLNIIPVIYVKGKHYFGIFKGFYLALFFTNEDYILIWVTLAMIHAGNILHNMNTTRITMIWRLEHFYFLLKSLIHQSFFWNQIQSLLKVIFLFFDRFTSIGITSCARMRHALQRNLLSFSLRLSWRSAFRAWKQNGKLLSKL